MRGFLSLASLLHLRFEDVKASRPAAPRHNFLLQGLSFKNIMAYRVSSSLHQRM